jgi:hypothetical protein
MNPVKGFYLDHTQPFVSVDAQMGYILRNFDLNWGWIISQVLNGG